LGPQLQQTQVNSIYVTQPAVVIPVFDGAPDAEALHKAMKGLGTDDKTLSRILSERTRDQLQVVKKVFEQKYGKSLASWIKGDTSGDYQSICLALIEDKADYDALKVYNAIKGLGTNDEELVEIICSRNNGEIQAMRVAYMKLRSVDIEKDVAEDTSGDYKRLLLTILKGDRPENQPVNLEQAKEDAKKLYAGGEGRFGTDENLFIDILCHRSKPQLFAINQAYGSIAGHSLERGVAKETSGNFKKCLTILLTPKEEFFAEQIRDSIEGLGTKDHKLIRAVNYISNNKDLCRAVNAYYMHKYKHTLAKDIAQDTSGWYHKTTVHVIENRVNF